MGIIIAILISFLTIVIVAVIAFIIWAVSARKPEIEALEAMKPNDHRPDR